MLEISHSQVTFFKQKFGVDVSHIKIKDETLREGDVGRYTHDTNDISVDTNQIRHVYKHASNVIIMTTMVHELTHYCQFKYNKSLTLPVNDRLTCKVIRNKFIQEAWNKKPTEIDAVITECYYCFTTYGDTEAVRTFIALSMSKFNRDDIKIISKYINRIKDTQFTECFNKSI